MPQQFAQHNAESNEQAQQAGQDQSFDGTQAQAAAESEESFDALDAVLDDIESTLETNAEEYVNSFVQKGGE